MIYLETIEHTYIFKELKVSDLQASAKAPVKGKYKTRMAEVLSLTLTEVNILLLEYYVSCSKASDVNTANFI